MSIVEPIDLRVINIACARVPEHPDVLTASIALKGDLSIIAPEKPCVIDERCNLPVRRLDDALFCGNTLARESASHK
jgi:hypothetical protein